MTDHQHHHHLHVPALQVKGTGMGFTGAVPFAKAYQRGPLLQQRPTASHSSSGIKPPLFGGGGSAIQRLPQIRPFAAPATPPPPPPAPGIVVPTPEPQGGIVRPEPRRSFAPRLVFSREPPLAKIEEAIDHHPPPAGELAPPQQQHVDATSPVGEHDANRKVEPTLEVDEDALFAAAAAKMDLDEMTALAATTEQQHPTSPSDQPVPHAPVARHVTTALAADHPEPLSGQSHNPTRRATKRRRLDDTGSLAGAVASLVVECEAVQEKDLKHQGEIQRLQGDLAVAVGDLSRERDASQQLKDRVTELGCRVAETSAQLSKTQAALDESIKFATAERRTLDHEREAREAAQKELSLLNIQLEHASANVSVGSQVAELSSAVTEKLSKLSLACASIDDALGGNHTAIEELATKRLDVPTSQLFARIGTCQETVTAQLGGLDAKVASCLLDKLKPLYVTELNRTVAKIRSDTLADSERALSSLTNDMRAKFHVMEDVASVREQLAVALAQSASMSAQREKETKDHQQLVSELAVEREKCVRLEGELASVRQERLTLQVCARSLEGQLKNTDASCMGLEHQLQAARHELATVRERTESLGEQLRDAVQARERAEADQVLGRKDLSATKEEALSLQFKLASETRARADAEATARRQLEEQVTLMTEKTNKLAIAEHSAQSATDRLNAITDQMAATQAQLDAAEAARIHLEEKLHMATEQAAAQVAETRRIEQHWTEQLRECNREWQTRLQQALSSAKNERELMSETAVTLAKIKSQLDRQAGIPDRVTTAIEAVLQAADSTERATVARISSVESALLQQLGRLHVLLESRQNQEGTHTDHQQQQSPPAAKGEDDEDDQVDVVPLPPSIQSRTASDDEAIAERIGAGILTQAPKSRGARPAKDPFAFVEPGPSNGPHAAAVAAGTRGQKRVTYGKTVCVDEFVPGAPARVTGMSNLLSTTTGAAVGVQTRRRREGPQQPSRDYPSGHSDGPWRR